MRVYFLLLVLILLSSGAGALSVGATPNSVDIEGLEPGEEHAFSIYLRVGSVDEEATIDLEVESNEIATSTLFSDNYGSHNKISEQSAEDWWSFDSTEVGPSVEIIHPEGEEFDGRVDITLNVPNEAEPGLRHGSLLLNSNLENQTGQNIAGANFQTNIRIPYSIMVEGDVRREKTVRDVRGFRTAEDEASVEVLVSNTGTVTTTSEDFEVDILDGRGNIKDSIVISGEKLKPGESEWMNAEWNGNIDEGSYQIDGEANYFTGTAYVSGSFSLSDIVEVVPEDSPAAEGEESGDLPVWLVLMVLVVLGVLMWGFEIDPVWIFGIVGVLGISAFVLMSNVSNLLLVGVLIPALLIVYLGV